jgi:hypothetical protein
MLTNPLTTSLIAALLLTAQAAAADDKVMDPAKTPNAASSSPPTDGVRGGQHPTSDSRDDRVREPADSSVWPPRPSTQHPIRDSRDDRAQRPGGGPADNPPVSPDTPVLKPQKMADETNRDRTSTAVNSRETTTVKPADSAKTEPGKTDKGNVASKATSTSPQ